MRKKHIIDLHVHSNFSDGRLPIKDVVDHFGKKGFSAIAIADHCSDSRSMIGFVSHKLNFSLSQSNIDQYLETLHSESKRAWEKYSMLLIPGVEITKNAWSKRKGAHFVLLGIDQFINPNREIKEILTDRKYEFSIAAHPVWDENFEFKTQYLWDHKSEFLHHFDAWEAGTAQKFSKEVFTSGLATISSSDFHNPTNDKAWRSKAYLDDLCPENIYDQIRKKQTEPIWI